MSLYEGDLADTILKQISIDEFHPKTGESDEVVVVGYLVTEESAAKDLYNFINNGVVPFRDVEVSPNPNPDGYYMVFVELDRDEGVTENIRSMTKDIENVAGELNWSASTHLTDDSFPLSSTEIEQYIIEDPEQYVGRDEFEEQQMNQETESKNSAILEFLKDSNVLDASITENVLSMRSMTDSATLEIVGFGNKEIMKDIGIAESAIKPYDSVIRTFNVMLGEMSVAPIDNYLVIFHPAQDTVLVTKQC